jgi:ATP-dependent DNA ligase
MPEGDDWLYELKLDGYRTRAVIDPLCVTEFLRTTAV